jgi:hypothetical protein
MISLHLLFIPCPTFSMFAITKDSSRNRATARVHSRLPNASYSVFSQGSGWNGDVCTANNGKTGIRHSLHELEMKTNDFLNALTGLLPTTLSADGF